MTIFSTRWGRLIPVAFVTYTFAYLDRSNYSIGAAGGLKDDLGLGARRPRRFVRTVEPRPEEVRS